MKFSLKLVSVIGRPFLDRAPLERSERRRAKSLEREKTRERVRVGDHNQNDGHDGPKTKTIPQARRTGGRHDGLGELDRGRLFPLAAEHGSHQNKNP